MLKKKTNLGRREFMKASLLGSALATTALTSGLDPGEGAPINAPAEKTQEGGSHAGHDGSMGTVGQVDNEANGFDPHEMLYDWDYGVVSTLPNGQTVREYNIVAVDKEIEIAPGVFFPAWTYNGRVPGPSLRCVEGDLVRINFLNAGTHPHTIHFHGIHSASMDGVPGIGAGMIGPGESTVYEFDAFPFGCHLYHCHAIPLKRHIHKGLYGAFVIDPDPEKYSGQEREVAKSRNHQWYRHL